MAKGANSAFLDGVHVLRALVILAIAPLMAWVMLSMWIVPGVTLYLRGVPVEARVVRSEIVPYTDSKDRPRFRAVVEVAYRWEGAERRSPAWRQEREAPTAKRKQTLERQLQDLGVGATTQVWVDPQAPDRASIERSFSGIHAGLLGIVPLAVLFAFEHLAKALASRRRVLAHVPGAPAIDPATVEAERHLGPNFGCASVLVVVVASAAGGGLAAIHPFAALAPVTACTALLLVGAARLVAAWRTNARWRRVRLVPASAPGDTLDADVVGLGPRAAARLAPRLVLRREERDHPPDDDAEWVVDATLGEVEVESRPAPGGALRLRAPSAPFGPLEPVPTFTGWAGDRPLIVDGRERRVRTLLVAGAGRPEVTFAWPPGEVAERERDDDEDDAAVSALWRPVLRVTGRPVSAMALATSAIVTLLGLLVLRGDARSGEVILVGLFASLALQLVVAAIVDRLARRDTRDLLSVLRIHARELRRGGSFEWRGATFALDTPLARARSVFSAPGLVADLPGAFRPAPSRPRLTLRSAVHLWWSFCFGWHAPSRLRRVSAECRQGGARCHVSDLVALLEQGERDDAVEDVVRDVVEGRLPRR